VRITAGRKAQGFTTRRLLCRSGFISGVLAAALLVAEIGGASSEPGPCRPLTARYDASNGGRLILATCWSHAPVLGPVIVHYQLDLHLMISTQRVDEIARTVR